MKTITSKRGKYALLLVFCGSVFLAGGLTAGLTQAQQAPESQPLAQVPQSGTFFLFSAGMSGLSSPPYPCNPYPSDWNIPVYLMENGNYLIGDSPEDVADILSVSRPANARAGQTRAGTNDLPPLLGLPGSGTNTGTVQVTLPTLDTNGLWLELLPGLSQYNSNTNYSTILVHNTWQDGEYMLQTSTSPASWLWDYAGSAIAVSNTLPFVGSLQQEQEDSRFYRAVDISPIAVPDFVQVQQGSEANVLDILRNDQTPNDEVFFVSDLFYSEYGEIDYAAPYEEDGVWISVPFEFFYTPKTNFNGIDYLGYGIENSRGGKNYADVFVFVNEIGNNSPDSLSNINLILETNIYTVSFNAITNMFDSNGDSLELFAVIPPQYGTVTGTSSGNITYTRNPLFFGDDSFTYIVTDGRGAMAEGKVVVELIKSMNDPEIPIQWLINYGLSTSNTNSFSDLDDDGLPNIAEFLLGTNPRLKDNPINLQTITNGTTLTGCAYFPLIGCGKILKSNRTAIGLLVNEEVSDDIYVTQGMDGTWFLKWDTSLVTNGTYSIQAFVEYGYGENEVVYGTQKNVAVYNSLQFNPLANRFSTTFCIDATLAANNTETNYTVYLYDEYDEQLVSGVMSVTDDRLYYGWNLCNPNGVQVVYGGIKAKFFPGTSQTNPSETGAILKSYEKEGHISYPNTFTVAWGWDEYGNSFVNQRTSLMRNGVINYLNSAALDNPYSVLPTPQNAPDISTAFCYDTFGDKNTLTNALAQSGNFFWFGHGAKHGYISGNPIFSSLSSDEIAKLLGNSNLPGDYMEQSMRPEWNKRPYRLTVLNSCYSHDKYMAAAFGVDFTEKMSNRHVSDYIDCGREPRAYVGWKGSIVVPASAWTGYLVSYYYQSAMSTLWSKWMNEKPLNECLDGFDGWIRGYTIFYGMRRWNISGCYDLRRSNPEVTD